jgi:hypothetical protein
LTERPVRPVIVVMVLVVAKHGCGMSLVGDEDAVEELASDAADEAFGDGVGPRCQHRCLDDADVDGGEHGVDGGGELGVAVPDEEPDRRPASSRSIARLRACWVSQAPVGCGDLEDGHTGGWCARWTRARRPAGVAGRPGWAGWVVGHRVTSSGCQRKIVDGVMSSPTRRRIGSSRVRAAITARSVQLICGRGVGRWSTASWWRRRRISISLAVSDRVRSTIQPRSLENIT